MSAYPSTADLAAFRRRLHDANRGTLDTSRCTIGPECSFEWTKVGAWPHELEHGIGFRVGTEPRLVAVLDNGSVARREAAAIRSRAYRVMVDRQDGSPALPWVPRTFGTAGLPSVLPLAWPEELNHGAPYTWRNR